MLFSLLRISFTTLLALVLIGVCLLAWYLTTDEGAVELANIVQNENKQLSIDISGGNFAEGINARQLTWSDDKTAIEAYNVQSDWNSPCLLRAKFCLNSLRIQQLDVRVKATNSNKNTRGAELPQISLPIAFEFKQLQLGKLRVFSDDLAEPFVIENLNFSGDVAKDAITLNSFSAAYQQHRIRGIGSIQLKDNYPLDFRIDSILADVIEQQDLNLSADINGDLSNLNLNVFTVGAVNANASGTIKPLESGTPVNLQVDWKTNSFELNNNKTIVSKNTTIGLIGVLQKLNTTISTTISGAGIPESEINIAGLIDDSSFKSSELEVKALEGVIKGTVDASWKDEVSWASNLYFKGINPQQFNAEFPGNIGGVLQSTGSVQKNGKVKFQVNPAVLQGKLRDYPLHAHSVLNFNDGAWDIKSLRLSSQDNNLQIAGEVNEKWNISGNLALNTIEKLLPHTQGNVAGEFSIAGDTLEPDIKLDFKAPALTHKTNSAKNISLLANINKLALRQSNINLTASSLAIDKQIFDQPTLDLQGKQIKHTLKLSSKGPQNLNVIAYIDGSLNKLKQWSGVLRDGSIDLLAENLTQTEPASLTINTKRKTLTMQAHCWATKGSSLCLIEDSVFGKQGQAKLQLSNYALSNLDYLLNNNTSLTGSGNVNLIANWDSDNPNNNNMTLVSTINSGSVNTIHSGRKQKLRMKFDAIDFQARASNTQISLSADVKTRTFGTANIDMKLDPRTKPMLIESGNVELRGLELAFLEAFLPRIENIAGTISTKSKISGPVNAPVLDGKLVLNKPKLQSPGLPVNVDDGQLVLTFKGKDISLNGQLNSSDDVLSISGNGHYSNVSDYRALINVKSDALSLSQKPLIESLLAPDLNITISPYLANIGGKVRVKQATINIKDLPEDATTTSSDIIIVNQQKNAGETAVHGVIQQI